MSEVAKEVETTAASPAAEVKKSPKPKAKKGAKSARQKASHPPTATMVQTAITDLKERGGSSLQAIKKYISSTYHIDSEKFAPFIKKYIKSSVVSGVLVQTKGKGASGSFKLATAAVTKKPKASTRPKREATKPAKETKPKTAKKAAAKSKAKAAKPAEKKAAPKPAKKAPVKSVSKSTKKSKSPAKKPKAPKPKTTKATGKKK